MKYKFLFFVTSILIVNQSLAAGYSTGITSTSGLATSYAGSVTGAHDASDMFNNPATITKLKNKEFIASISYLNLDIDPREKTGPASSNTASAQVDDAGNNAFIPAFYLASPINDKTSIGFLINSPFGLSSEYNPSWAGKNKTTEASITTVNLGTNIAHKLHDNLSLGFGINTQYLKYVSTSQLYGGNKSRSSDWGYGYNLGLTYNVNDLLEFGVAYKSKVEHKLTGSLSTGAIGGFNIISNLETPESATIGAAYKLNDKLKLMSDITWTRWSINYDSKIFNAANYSQLGATTIYDYNDSYLYSIGGDYQYNDDLLIRFGTAYEDAATTNAHREPAIPVGDRIWFSTGFNYKLSDIYSIDASYLHQFYKTVKANIDTTTMKYRTSIDVASLALKINF